MVLILGSTWAAPASALSPHPLDPLSESEIAAAVSVIAASGNVDRTTRAAMITLKEPDKQQVIDWTEGEPAGRRAFAVLRVDGETFEAIVDLAASRLESWTRVPGAEPPIHSAEWAAAQRLVKADPRWRAAMRARGYSNVEDIFCESLSAGFFGTVEEAGRRLLKMPCYDISGAVNNVYARPIEGVIATVDLDAGRVADVLDEGVVPVVAEPHEFDEESVAVLRDPMRPVHNSAPEGWNFNIDGRMVRWQGWSFHLGFDQRFGPVLSLVAHEDGGESRSVLYQGQVSEVFVPYMDPSESWSFRTYLDAGEFGLGALSSPLMPGVDCPEDAVFIDATLSTPTGGAYRRERAICVFERNTAAPLWRHSEALNKAYEGRPAVELVVRSIPSVAHYDYVIDWVFTLSGEIQVNLGATGIDAVKGVHVHDMADSGAGAATEHGALVAGGLAAVNHDHYFSVRLDFDIDGPVNRFVRERLTPVTLAADNRRRSLWRLEAAPMPTEGGLSAQDGPQVWRIENPTVTTALGHHPSYQIDGDGPVSLLAPEDWPQRRGAFSARNLWITARHKGELYAAGAYPNQSRGGDGLPAYVDGESIDGSDIVAWYTIGFRHVTRPEDWPVLSTIWQGVTIRPQGFFTRNPGVGVRRRFLANSE
jgi:primary-amine oxidase